MLSVIYISHPHYLDYSEVNIQFIKDDNFFKFAKLNSNFNDSDLMY